MTNVPQLITDINNESPKIKTSLEEYDKLEAKCDNNCNNCMNIYPAMDPHVGNVEDGHCSTKTECSSDLKYEESNFYCSFCEFITNEENDFVNHSTTSHKDINPFKCTSCDDEYPTYGYLYKHLDDHLESDNKIRCQRCGGAITIQETLYHLNLCKKRLPYECVHCAKCFELNEIRMNHESGHNKTCTYCKASFFMLEEFETHLKDVHIRSINGEDLEDHVSMEKEESIETIENGIIPKQSQNNNKKDLTTHKITKDAMVCLYCPQVFENIKTFENHCKETHKTPLIYECFTCNKRFSSTIVRKLHLRQKHGFGNIACKYCKKPLKNEMNANMHILNCAERLNTVTKLFECFTCNLRFTTEEERTSHLVMHNSTKKILCQICNKHICEKEIDLHISNCAQSKVLSEQTPVVNEQHEEKCDEVICLTDSESNFDEDLLEPLRSDYEDNGDITDYSLPTTTSFESTSNSKETGNRKKRCPKWCLYCPTNFHIAYDLITHTKKVHNTSLVHDCYSCDERFNNVTDRRIHMTAMHGTYQKIKCKYCQMLIYKEHNMNIHYFQCKGNYWAEYGGSNKNACTVSNNIVDNSEPQNIVETFPNTSSQSEVLNRMDLSSTSSELYRAYELKECRVVLKDVFKFSTEEDNENHNDQTNDNDKDEFEDIPNNKINDKSKVSEQNTSGSMIKVTFKDAILNESQHTSKREVLIHQQIILMTGASDENKDACDKTVDDFDVDAIDIDDTGFEPVIEERSSSSSVSPVVINNDLAIEDSTNESPKTGSTVYGENVTCYQCTKNKDVECESEFLLPCPAKFDRCATHVTKYASTGFQIKRECGLGPCDFNDFLMNNNLGMKCDTSKREYSCLSCCKGTGCNNSSDQRSKISWTLFVMVLLLIFVQIVKDFQPPYVLNYDLS